MVVDCGDGAAQAALLIVGGQPLIELQARIGHDAGIARFIVLVDALPAALVVSIDRLRDQGLEIDLARDAADAADRVHPEDQILVVTAGRFVPRTALASLLRAAPLIAAVPDAAEAAHLERIDSTRRWAGVAIVPGALLRSTAQMLGDWTLGPTLLRMALQAGVPVREADGVQEVRSPEQAKEVSRELIGDQQRDGGAITRYIANPLISTIAPALFARRLPLGVLTAFPFVLLLVSVAAALSGYPLFGLGLFLFAIPARALARLLSTIGGGASGWRERTSRLMLPAFAVSASALAWQAYGIGHEWGIGALISWLIVALALQPATTERPAWLADPETSALLLLAGAMAGHPLAGVMIALAHAVVSQYWLVRRST